MIPYVTRLKALRRDTLLPRLGVSSPMGQKVSLPDAPPPAPGAGAEAPKSPTGGQLFKFEGEAYALFHPNVTPELFDDGDDESPQWILDVRAFISAFR
jgi:hypothetical protein